MQTNKEAEQVTLSDLGICCGKMFQEPSPAELPKARTSVSSSKRSSELSAVPFMSLDLTPGHGNLLGESYWELISPWLGDAWMDNDNIHSAYRGDIFYADLEPVRGSEQGGVRPVLIIQNDIGNRHSPTVIVAAITSRIKHHRLPTHVNLNGRQCGLHNESTIMLEQLRTLDKQRLLGYAGTVGKSKMREVNTALEISIGIKDLLPDNKRKRGSNYGKSEHREEKHQADPDDY